MKPIIWVVNILVGIFGTQASANVLTDQPIPIGHCYHWLQTAPGYLDFKYAYAKDNGNELTFYTSPATSNGSVAGPGLYCAKSPSGSYGYGNRLIRIEFVRDVVILDASTGKKHCGHDGRFYANDQECQSKDWDVKLYNRSPDWYVIQNPRAVMSWSATIPEVASDIQAETSYADSGYRAHAQATINLIQQDVAQNGVRNMVNARARMGFAEIVKSEKLLRSLPALTVLAEFNRPETKKIDAALLAQVLDATITRVLEDASLPWSDVKPIVKSNKKIKQAFLSGIQKQIAALAGKENTQKNFDVMLLISAQKDSGITPEQIQTLVIEIFKNPTNFGQTRYAKGDLSEDLKKQLLAELTRRVQAPETKNDLNMLASLVSFTSLNNLDKQIKTDVTALFYEHVKTMTASKFSLGNRKTKYPLGDTVQIAVQLCQAHITAYNLVNKDLSISSGDLRLEVGQISDLSNAAAFCQQQASLMDVMAAIPKKGDGKIFVIKGTIQALPFKFIALDQESVAPQLASFIKKNNLAQIDRMIYSVNDSADTDIYNRSAYWTGDQLAQMLMTKLPEQGVFSRQEFAGFAEIAKKTKGKANKIDMVFEGIAVKFAADYIEDFDEQCKILAPTLDNKMVDDITFTMNGKTGQVNNSDWWRSATESCGAIRPHLIAAGLVSLLEKKALIEVARLGKGKSKQVDAKFEKFEVTLGIDNLEDFDEQCKLLSPTLEGKMVDDISFIINKDPNQRGATNNSGWWKTTDESCGALRAQLILKGISSKLHMAALADIARRAVGKSKQILMMFEQIQVTFGVDNIEEFDEQCVTLKHGFDGQSMDDISFTINGRQTGSVRNGGWWTTAADSCAAVRPQLLANGVFSKVEYAAIAEINRRAQGKKLQILATFNNREIGFGVNNLEEFVEQCKLLGTVLDNQRIGQITYSLSKADPVEVRFPSYLDTTQEVCSTLKAGLVRNGSVLPKAVMNIAANKDKYRYSFTAVLDSMPLTFAVNSVSEINKQCESFLTSTGITQANNITLRKEGWHDKDAIDGNYKFIPRSICSFVETASFGFVPTEEQAAVLQLTGKYTVQASFNGTPLTMKVNSADQLYGQCLNIMDEAPEARFNWVSIRVNGENRRSISDNSASWSNSEACRILAKGIQL